MPPASGPGIGRTRGQRHRHARAAALAGALAAAALAACAPTTLTTTTPLAVEGREIAPFEFHEECGDIAAGERVDFRFTATRPVHFEIYYKDGIARIAPVVRDDVTEASGIFPPPASRRYCVRWDVGRKGAIIDYKVRVLPRNNP